MIAHAAIKEPRCSLSVLCSLARFRRRRGIYSPYFLIQCIPIYQACSGGPESVTPLTSLRALHHAQSSVHYLWEIGVSLRRPSSDLREPRDFDRFR